MINKSLPLPDLAAVICDACKRSGIDIVLSGGACVSIYTKNKFESFDLDFVLQSHVSRTKIKPVVEALGFKKDGRHFRHPESPYIVEFLSPPLSVGEESVREIREMRRGKMTLKLLSPTDCVKDRLAAFYHWNDRPSLDQAIMVCKDTQVDLREVKRWSTNEGMRDRFDLFKKTLAKAEKH
ncbi:MAG: hypothetical protein IMZ57_06155 [Acidobacteria bacterium]|nr:hypothetical protein [Acidobacteriota bacterium]